MLRCYDPSSIDAYWRNYISILWNNSLQHLVPENIEFTLDILDEPYGYYAVSGAKVPRRQYMAGDTVDVQVALRKYLGDTQYTNISLKIPSNISSGTYSLVVGSEITIDSELMSVFPDYYTIRTTKQLLDELKRPINTHSLQVVLIDSEAGGIIGNKFFAPIPESKLSMFKSRTTDWQNLWAPRTFKNNIIMDDPVIGGEVVNIEVIGNRQR